MKKILFALAALVVIVSGVAAVSAYEAHLINVKAHVELALNVDTTEIDFGTVFPEEWLVEHRLVKLSDSAIGELGTAVGDLESVEITLFAEWKPIGTTPETFYNWAGYFTYFGWNVDTTAGLMTLVGDPPADKPGAKQVAGPFTLTTGADNNLYVAIDVPDFEGYYNSLTDVNPKPSGLAVPTYIVPKLLPDGTANPAYIPTGADFGLDMKVQVTNITRVTPAPAP